MLVGTSVCPRGEQSILSQRGDLKVTFTNHFLVFAIVHFCFCCRAPSGWDLQDFKRVEKSLANQVNSIPASDATARHCPIAIEFYMPPGHRSCCQVSSLEKTAVVQPSINAKKINRMRHVGNDVVDMRDRYYSSQ